MRVPRDADTGCERLSLLGAHSFTLSALSCQVPACHRRLCHIAGATQGGTATCYASVTALTTLYQQQLCCCKPQQQQQQPQTVVIKMHRRRLRPEDITTTWAGCVCSRKTSCSDDMPGKATAVVADALRTPCLPSCPHPNRGLQCPTAGQPRTYFSCRHAPCNPSGRARHRQSPACCYRAC